MTNPKLAAISDRDSNDWPPGLSIGPRWLRDFLQYLPVKSQFVLSGNILDLQAYEVAPGTVSIVSLQAAIARELYANGYRDVLSMDCITEPALLSKTGSRQPATAVLARLGGKFALSFDRDRSAASINPAFEGLYGIDGTAQWECARDN
jgi:hypothetical protein